MGWVVIIAVQVRQITTLSTQARILTRLLSHSRCVDHESVLRRVHKKREIKKGKTGRELMIQQPHFKDTTLYLPVESIHVYVCFLGPLLPELGIVQSNICAVLRRHEAGLGEGGSFAFTLYSDGSCSSLKDLIDVLLTETAALVVLIHYGGISTFTKQILYLLLGELLDLRKVYSTPLSNDPPQMNFFCLQLACFI